MDEPPGPPFSQMASGALAGSLRDSKNQKKLRLDVNDGYRQSIFDRLRVDRVVLWLAIDVIKETRRQPDVARVRLDTWSRFADSRLAFDQPRTREQSWTDFIPPPCTKWSRSHGFLISGPSSLQASGEIGLAPGQSALSSGARSR